VEDGVDTGTDATGSWCAALGKGSNWAHVVSWGDLSWEFRKGIEDGFIAGPGGHWPPWDPKDGPDPAKHPDYQSGFVEGKAMRGETWKRCEQID
jgi:hypothetical protein